MAPKRNFGGFGWGACTNHTAETSQFQVTGVIAGAMYPRMNSEEVLRNIVWLLCVIAAFCFVILLLCTLYNFCDLVRFN